MNLFQYQEIHSFSEHIYADLVMQQSLEKNI